MRIVTYLGFTLLSILIQFSVMDFIQSMMHVDEKLEPTLSNNASSQKRHLRDVFKDIEKKPHALYYRTQMTKLGKANAAAKIYDNTSLPDLLITTESTTTAVFEVLYDENEITSATEVNTSFTTETVFATTEFENITEITFFEKTNTTKPHVEKKINKDCKCNFLIGVCDINCCCDVDCSEVEITLFPNCTKKQTKIIHHDDVCYLHLFHFSQDGPTAILNDWLCIAKTNLPNSEIIKSKKIHSLGANNFITWKGIIKHKLPLEFTNKIYEYGDPIWLIKNGSIYYIDLPSPVINNYCNGRRTLQFLKDHKFSCQVKIRDLEMFQILRSSEEANVISATPLSMNSTHLNCSNLHCVNWTLIFCENLICSNYNKSVHEPMCTESICTNLALKLEYIFNYHDSKITNATIKFHVQNVSVDMNFMTQDIEVKFFLANESADNVLKLSGNPGYIQNLPIVVSYSDRDYTDTFYNKTLKVKSYFTLPESQGGNCAISNSTNNLVLFGANKRMKCRYYHKNNKLQNSTEQCRRVQNNIDSLIDLKKLSVSPLGDPYNLKDEDWILLEKNVSNKELLYGELYHKSSKLNCYNIITRFSFVFGFAKIDGNNRIVEIKLDTTFRNASFSLDDLSSVVTIDVNFIDVTKPNLFEYSLGPSLNFHLPNDLFFPFPSNGAQVVSLNLFYLMLYCCITIMEANKITV